MNYEVIFEGEIFFPEHYIPNIFSSSASPQPLFRDNRIKGYKVVIEFGGEKFSGTGFTREEAIYNAVAYATHFLKLVKLHFI